MAMLGDINNQAFHGIEGTKVNMPKKAVRSGRGRLGLTICAVALMVIAPPAIAATAAQKGFASPEEGITALVKAVRANDQPALRAVLGPHGGKLISSGDAVADQHRREAFLKAYDDANKLVHNGDARATLVIGKDEWPMPIPLVRAKGGWRFDTRQGEKEILARRIGRNELAAIQVCLAILDAEREYAALDVDSDGIPEYASKFVSATGRRDGLYWETKAGEPTSPLGPLLAAAAREGYPSAGSGPLAPYHGYFYKILTRQGKDALGGGYDYFVNGKMIGGFAMIAYPARYGASGVMSFVVNHDGVVYEKNLGKNTAALASKMTMFNPDASWKRP
jgi:hypothetical protein